jgi:hypothetical protein
MAESSSNAKATKSGGLRQIRVGPKVGTLYVALFHSLSAANHDSILAVGGVGTTPPEHWTNSGGELWLGTLDAKSAPDIGIVSFPTRLAANGILSGRELEEEGASLLAELHRLTVDETVSPFGGLLCKADHYRWYDLQWC